MKKRGAPMKNRKRGSCKEKKKKEGATNLTKRVQKKTTRAIEHEGGEKNPVLSGGSFPGVWEKLPNK